MLPRSNQKTDADRIGKAKKNELVKIRLTKGEI